MSEHSREACTGLSRSTAVLGSRDTDAVRANSPKRVLVVEDEPSVARLITDILREEGHQVDFLLDSRQVLSLALRNDYDLLICDLRMPYLDGPAVYRALERAQIPLRFHMIIVTGDMLGAGTATFLERTRLRYVAKPFLVEEFKLAVQQALSGAGAISAVRLESHVVEPARSAVREK